MAILLTLKLLGTAFVEGPDAPVTGRAVQGRRLALLALLALARGRPVTRDRIVALLWPESPPARARPQLSDALYIVRTALGDDVVLSTGDDVALNPQAISSDVATFERLLDEHQLEAAVALFAGPLLDGFHLSDTAEFEHWLDGERARLAGLYASALEALADACERGDDFTAAAGWWRRLAAHDPYSGRVALRLMRACDAVGDRAGALQHARIHATLLREEFDAQPDPEVSAFAERLRGEPQVRAAKAEPGSRGAPASPSVPSPSAASGASPSVPSQSAALASAAPSLAGEHGPAQRASSPRFLLAHVEPGRAPAPIRTKRGYGVAAGMVVVLAAVALYGGRGGGPAAVPSAAQSVGVLPFVNMSADPDHVYFSDGLTEEIIAALSRIDGLRVAARTSSFALRDGTLDVRAIGDTLGVGAVLEGSVRRDGDRLRISAQLIDAATGYHIWSDEYDRELKDVFAVQQEIAVAIAGALQLRLAGGSMAQSARPQPDLEAYDLYLRGLFLRNKLTGEALLQASDYFDGAIALEPGFAAAYAAKATIVGPLIMFGHVPFEEGLAEFRALTAHALELDPELGEAHGALGLLRLFFDWDWDGAAQSLRRAVELNPSDPHAHHHLGNYLRAMGRFEEAIAARERATRLDPLNARTVLLLGSDYVIAGDLDRALIQYERGVALDPVNALALGSGPWLPAGPAEAYLWQRRYDEAVEDYVRIASLRGASATETKTLRDAFADAGMPGFWRRWLAMDLRQSGGDADPLRVARLWALIGDTAQAIDGLERAYRARNPGLINLRVDPYFADLRSHPRVARIVSEMKFPER